MENSSKFSIPMGSFFLTIIPSLHSFPALVAWNFSYAVPHAGNLQNNSINSPKSINHLLCVHFTVKQWDSQVLIGAFKTPECHGLCLFSFIRPEPTLRFIVCRRYLQSPCPNGGTDPTTELWLSPGFPPETGRDPH